MEPFDRIVVRMPNWIGDVVMATPLVRTLRENLPRAHLAVLVLPSGAKVLEGSAGIDQVIVYDRKGKDASVATRGSTSTASAPPGPASTR